MIILSQTKKNETTIISMQKHPYTKKIGKKSLLFIVLLLSTEKIKQRDITTRKSEE